MIRSYRDEIRSSSSDMTGQKGGCSMKRRQLYNSFTSGGSKNKTRCHIDLRQDALGCLCMLASSAVHEQEAAIFRPIATFVLLLAGFLVPSRWFRRQVASMMYF